MYETTTQEKEKSLTFTHTHVRFLYGAVSLFIIYG